MPTCTPHRCMITLAPPLPPLHTLHMHMLIAAQTRPYLTVAVAELRAQTTRRTTTRSTSDTDSHWITAPLTALLLGSLAIAATLTRILHCLAVAARRSLLTHPLTACHIHAATPPHHNMTLDHFSQLPPHLLTYLNLRFLPILMHPPCTMPMMTSAMLCPPSPHSWPPPSTRLTHHNSCPTITTTCA